MSTLFSIACGNLTDNIFARSINTADCTWVTNEMAIGTVPVDVSPFASDGSNIWGVSFNVAKRDENPVGLFSCKRFKRYLNYRNLVCIGRLISTLVTHVY